MTNKKLREIEGYDNFKADERIAFFKCKDEYPGWTGTEKYIISTDVPEDELKALYPQVMSALHPYLLINSKFGVIRNDYFLIERRIDSFSNEYQIDYDFENDSDCSKEYLVDCNSAFTSDLKMDLEKALPLLSNNQRRRFIDYYIKGLTLDEIGKKKWQVKLQLKNPWYMRKKFY